jgi:hypothetical protein
VAHLTRASEELYRRQADERFDSLQTLWEHCRGQRRQSQDRWHPPGSLGLESNGSLRVVAGQDGTFSMNDWSFGQLCRLAGVARDTVNRLSPDTARRVFDETLPRSSSKPLQVLTSADTIRSIHGTQYTRLWNADLVQTLLEFAVDFQPPQKGFNGATGLYAGEQDCFCFLIDPNGWAEIGGEAFAPGFFVWNSEVGRRSLGISTFWFQAVCANHIVWDATEVVEWTRKHTGNVGDGLTEIRRMVDALVQKRDARKDGFASVIAKAMREKLGDDAEEALKALARQGISRSLARKALEIGNEEGRFTVWSVVDGLTKLAREAQYAGERAEADEKASQLLSLVAS